MIQYVHHWIAAIRMLLALMREKLTLAAVRMDIRETAQSAQILMNAIQEQIHVIQMQHVRIMLAHTHVNATVDSVETELCARI